MPLDHTTDEPTPVRPASRRTWSQEEIDRLMAEILAEVERFRELPGYSFVDDEWEDDEWEDDEPPTPDDAEVLTADWRPVGGGGRPGAPLGDVTLPIEAKLPLTDAAAIDLIRLAMAVPAEPQTVALLFDEQRTGGIVVVVSGTVEPDAVIDVVGHLAATAASLGEVTSMVVASIRPHRTCDGLDDVDRWFCLDEVAEFHDLQLVEWYVVDGAGSVTRPRDLTFEPSRW